MARKPNELVNHYIYIYIYIDIYEDIYVDTYVYVLSSNGYLHVPLTARYTRVAATTRTAIRRDA